MYPTRRFKKLINASGCSVPGCDAEATCQGMCKIHYERKRTGKALQKPTREDEFLSRFDKIPGGCWIWTAGKQRSGYGVFCYRGVETAHRASWLMFRGELPPGAFVCHRCDNPSCVNPDHLFLGTNAENVADMMAKGRNAKRERNGHAKLREADVVEIRQAVGSSNRELARRYGVSAGLISMVRSGKRWA